MSDVAPKLVARARFAPDTISASSVAALVTAIGYALGPTSKMGRFLLWSNFILIFLVPMAVASILNRIDMRRARVDREKQHDEVRKLADACTDPKKKQRIMNIFNDMQVEHAIKLQQASRDIYQLEVEVEKEPSGS
ncbi:hypothetical protein [Streptomyces sp. NPDC059639]|uniref:hypothetical protein n=1 Tax=Streptomyces sp. NPDC059639 TaxID=3346891 RepID=UPI00369CBC19